MARCQRRIKSGLWVGVYRGEWAEPKVPELSTALSGKANRWSSNLARLRVSPQEPAIGRIDVKCGHSTKPGVFELLSTHVAPWMSRRQSCSSIGRVEVVVHDVEPRQRATRSNRGWTRRRPRDDRAEKEQAGRFDKRRVSWFRDASHALEPTAALRRAHSRCNRTLCESIRFYWD